MQLIRRFRTTVIQYKKALVVLVALLILSALVLHFSKEPTSELVKPTTTTKEEGAFPETKHANTFYVVEIKPNKTPIKSADGFNPIFITFSEAPNIGTSVFRVSPYIDLETYTLIDSPTTMVIKPKFREWEDGIPYRIVLLSMESDKGSKLESPLIYSYQLNKPDAAQPSPY